MKQRIIAIFMLGLVVALAGLTFAARGDAAPNAAPTDVGGQGSEITLVAQANHVGSGASDWKCDEGQFTNFITEVTISGTMTGTNPTDALVLQHSIDHGTSVAGNVTSFTTINATVTPAVQTDTRISGVVIANTPVAYGRCWRVVWTAGGTGSPALNFAVVQYRH
jgi:hypothetical protein